MYLYVHRYSYYTRTDHSLFAVGGKMMSEENVEGGEGVF